MASEKMTLLELARKGQEPGEDFLRDVKCWTMRELMEAEVSAQIGAQCYLRTDERTTRRNGYPEHSWDTRLSTLELQIPRLRAGAHFPSWLEQRKRLEQALVAEGYVNGVSTCKVEALAQALGIASLSTSEVSRLCESLDEQVSAFRNRRLDAVYPSLWLDARYEKVRGTKVDPIVKTVKEEILMWIDLLSCCLVGSVSLA